MTRLRCAIHGHVWRWTATRNVKGSGMGSGSLTNWNRCDRCRAVERTETIFVYGPWSSDITKVVVR